MILEVSFQNFSKTNGGQFEGWGTSLCWWAHRVGYSSELCQKAAKLFFSKDGLNLNIMRYNIGGGDDPSHKHIKRSDSAVPGWVYLNEKGEKIWNYTADKNQLGVLKSAVDVLGDDAYVELFSNSPPYFMTQSGCSSGSENGNDTNLKQECVEEFAAYLADTAKYISEKLHIKVKSLSPMNEPDTDYWKMNSPKQEGCHISSGEEQSRLLCATRKALDKRGLFDVLVAASDETSTKQQINSYKLYSREAKRAIGRISTHTYITDQIEQLGALCKQEGFNLWMSEVDGGSTAGDDAGQMSAALWLSKKIISDMNALSPSAWVLWLVIDYHKSKDGFHGNEDFCDYDINKGFWGLGHCDHDKKEFILTQKYYAFGQFTRYIRKGMIVIHINEDNIAAYDKKNNQCVIVSVNCEKREREVTFHFDGFSLSNSFAKVITTYMAENEAKSWAEGEDIKLENNCLFAKLKPNSVTTFVVNGVKLA